MEAGVVALEEERLDLPCLDGVGDASAPPLMSSDFLFLDMADNQSRARRGVLTDVPGGRL